MKKRNILYTLAGSILLLLSTASCSDFLEPKSPNEYVPKDANALQELLIGAAYPTAYGGNRFLTFVDCFSDDWQFHKLDASFADDDIGRETALQALFTWQPDMFITMETQGYSYNNIWQGYYKYILGTNAVLDYIGDVKGTDEEKNYVIAQALALRGFYYFMLVNHFGAPYNYDKDALGVPLKLESKLNAEDEVLIPRNTVGEVYKQVLADLNEAERCFLTLPKAKQYQLDYMMNLPAVQLLKSRLFLYMENWAEAAKYANKVITDWNFSLLDLNNLPEPTKKEPYYNFVSPDSPEAIWFFGNIDDLAGINESVALEIEGPSGKSVYRDVFIASDELLNSFEENDLRKDNYIVKEFDNTNTEFLDSYSVYGKFKISSKGAPQSGESFALALRLSEAYLNLAEASALNQQEGTALNAMKTLLEKRYKTDTYQQPANLTGETLVNFIRNERRKELCFEGQRWFDLRRYGMPSFSRMWAKKIYTLKKNDPSYTMPIPEEVLRENSSLEQNPLAPSRKD